MGKNPLTFVQDAAYVVVAVTAPVNPGLRLEDGTYIRGYRRFTVKGEWAFFEDGTVEKNKFYGTPPEKDQIGIDISAWSHENRLRVYRASKALRKTVEEAKREASNRAWLLIEEQCAQIEQKLTNEEVEILRRVYREDDL